MAEKPQFKFYAEPHLIERLDRCAARVGSVSAQQFVIEALSTYAETLADLLIELRKIEQEATRRQREELLARLRQFQVSGIDLEDDRVKSRRK